MANNVGDSVNNNAVGGKKGNNDMTIRKNGTNPRLLLQLRCIYK